MDFTQVLSTTRSGTLRSIRWPTQHVQRRLPPTCEKNAKVGAPMILLLIDLKNVSATSDIRSGGGELATVATMIATAMWEVIQNRGLQILLLIDENASATTDIRSERCGS